MFAQGLGRIFRERDAIVMADIVEGFATKDLGLGLTTELGELSAAGLEVTVKGAVGDVGQFGQF